jgi:hypothetical protein
MIIIKKQLCLSIVLLPGKECQDSAPLPSKTMMTVATTTSSTPFSSTHLTSASTSATSYPWGQAEQPTTSTILTKNLSRSRKFCIIYGENGNNWLNLKKFILILALLSPACNTSYNSFKFQFQE